MSNTLTLMPFQREGATWLQQAPRRLLGDEMGLGKTPQLIVAANEVGVRRATIVADTIGRIHWERHLAAWAPHLDAEVFTYEQLSRDPELARRTIEASDLLIADEAHRLKTPTAKRTRAVYALPRLPQRVWAATGTFAPNHAGELWTHFKALFGEPMSHDAWIRRYCIAYPTAYGLRIIGNKKETLPELREKLARVMLRRRAIDVLKDLPPIRWGEMVLDPAQANAARGKIAEVQQALWVEEFERIMARTGDEDRALAEAEPHLSEIRNISGEIKAPLVAAQIAAELEAGHMQKVVVFAYHHAALRALREQLADFSPVYVDGGTSEKARDAAQQNFQNNPNCRVFIGQVEACSTTISLTAAEHVVFVELAFNPGTNAQAAKRAHRIGQLRPVLVRTASLAGTIDEAVNRVLARKSRMLSEIFD